MASDLILGAGVTGLAAGIASGLPVYEAVAEPGGICSSYYVRPGETQRFPNPPVDGNAYRFEIGGGHWIFGGDPAIVHFIESLTPVRKYQRRSSVFFPDSRLFVPYPIQNHLRFLGSKQAASALAEMTAAATGGAIAPGTMKDWLQRSFGPTLCRDFFFPFHDLYTAGLYDRIVPQDAYKSPVDLSIVVRGAFDDAPPVGYNATFLYPIDGLGTLAHKMASRCKVHFNKRAARIDTTGRTVHFADGSKAEYRQLLSTLPLNQMTQLTGVDVPSPADPYTSVLVLNIGASKGADCPPDHWLYVPHSESGFHRVGFYNNVDASFLPAVSRAGGDRASIYVERAYVGGSKPAADEIDRYSRSVVRELQSWGWIGKAEVVDPTWIDVAYTWASPGSKWKKQAIESLEQRGIFQVGRYGRWIFQGIADSIRDGFYVGASFRAA